MGLRKLIACLLLITAAFSTINAQTPYWQWAKTAGGVGYYDGAYGIASDAKGNIYVAGDYDSTTVFGTTVLSGGGTFLAKYDSSGNLIWVKSSTGSGTPNAICTDFDGNIYITGAYDSSIAFGSHTLTSTGTGQENVFFIVKYDSSGNVIWANSSVDSKTNSLGNGYDFGIGISTDNKGNVYSTGVFQSDSITFGSIVLSDVGGDEAMFIVKYSSSGDVIWAKGDVNVSGGWSISVDTASNSYITGYTPYADSVLLIKYDSSGNLIWEKADGGEVQLCAGTCVKTDLAGNIYLTGEYEGLSLTFGNITLTSPDYLTRNIFTVKYDASGNVIWAKGDNTMNGAYAHSISVDGDQGAYITGYFASPSVTFDSLTLTGFAEQNVFVVKYDSLGNVVWGLSAAGTGNTDIGYSITTSATGSVYIAGYFDSTSIDFGGITLVNPGIQDLFVAKIAVCNPPQAPVNTTSPDSLTINNDNSTTLTATGSGTLSWYSDSVGGNYLGSGTSFTTAVLTKTITYYVQDSTCEASARTAITVTVTCVPPSPPANTTSPSEDTVQYGNITELTVSGAGTFGWYSADSNGEYLGDGSTFYTPALDTTTTFYVQDSTCGASTRTAITVTVTGGCTPPAPPTNTTPSSEQSINSGNITELSASGSGVLGWYSDSSGGNYLGGGTSFITPELFSTTTFYVQDSTCGASGRTAITVTVGQGCTPPAAPVNMTNASALTILKGNITELTVNGVGTFGWYSADSGGIYLGGDSTFITPELDSTTSFYVQDSTCGASARTAITVTVTYGMGIATVDNKNGITVYPNPSDGNLNFNGVKNGYTLEVYDVFGQAIYSLVISQDNFQVNLAGDAKGVYLYRVLNQGAFIQQGKIILQ